MYDYSKANCNEFKQCINNRINPTELSLNNIHNHQQIGNMIEKLTSVTVTWQFR